MTLTDVREDIMPYCGHTVWTNVPTYVKKRIARDLNETFQDIYKHGPDFVREQERNARVYAPRNLTGKTIAQYASSFTADTGTAVDTSHLGCICYLGSVNSAWNTIKTVDAALVGATLREPNMGTALTAGTVIVEGDAFLLPSDVAGVQSAWFHGREGCDLDPMTGAEYRDAVRAPNRNDWPSKYFIETYSATQKFLRLWPLPSANGLVKYMANLRPTAVTVADMDTGTADVSVLGNDSESIVLPILRFKFSTFPLFNADEDKAELGRRAEAAMNGMKAMNPQVQDNRRVERRRNW